MDRDESKHGPKVFQEDRTRKHRCWFGNEGDSTTHLSIQSRPMLVEDWNALREGLWRETHPWVKTYRTSQYTKAVSDLTEFSKIGDAAHHSYSSSSSSYQIYYSDVTINLYNITNQLY
jgi:hypothetical protein